MTEGGAGMPKGDLRVSPTALTFPTGGGVTK